MFAIFKSGGKQYKAQAGDIIKLDKIEDASKGTVDFTDIVMVGGESVTIGSATKSAKVTAEVVTEGRDDKVIVFKKKRRQNYRRKIGHRQAMTLVRVTSITGPDGKTVKAEAPAKKPAAKKETAANDAAAKKAAPAKKADTTATEKKAAPAKKKAATADKPAAAKKTTKKTEKKD